MNIRQLTVAVGMMVLVVSSAHSSVFKGQRAYMRLCKKCHGSGGEMTAKHTQEEWEQMYANNAEKLIKLHEKDEKAMKKLKSRKFEKNIKHLRQFFHKYASDGGEVPACN